MTTELCIKVPEICLPVTLWCVRLLMVTITVVPSDYSIVEHILYIYCACSQTCLLYLFIELIFKQHLFVSTINNNEVFLIQLNCHTPHESENHITLLIRQVIDSRISRLICSYAIYKSNFRHYKRLRWGILTSFMRPLITVGLENLKLSKIGRTIKSFETSVLHNTTRLKNRIA